MQDVIDRVMRAYGLIVSPTPDEEEVARARLTEFLRDKEDDAHRLSVEGMKFLRDNRTLRGRRVKPRMSVDRRAVTS